jgi:hypothetical protein
MKKCNENIEAKVVETMALLDEMAPLEVHHLFRVKLMQRVEREFGEEAVRANGRMSHRLDFRLAFMALLLVVNLGSALISVFDGNRPAGASVGEVFDNQSDDYSSQEFAYYDQTTTTTTTTSYPAATGTESNQTP